MFEDITQELVQLTKEVRDREVRISELKEQALNEMKARDLQTLKTDTYSISLGARKTYTYSDTVKKLEEEVKLKKVEEEERGIASVKVSEYITVRV